MSILPPSRRSPRRLKHNLCSACAIIIAILPILSSSAEETNNFNNISPDAAGLFTFRAGADPTGTILQSWVGPDPCVNGTKSAWRGIHCNGRRRVVSVQLDNLNLNGSFPEHSLSKLTQVKYITLSFNQFTGEIPDLSNCSSLLQLWLQNNEFSGEIPNFVTQSRKLEKLDLSQNGLQGRIPDFDGASSLVVLDLSDNFLNGTIPSLNISSLLSFDVSNNQLQGAIPETLNKFPPSGFLGNHRLCGAPLPIECPSESRVSPGVAAPSPSPSSQAEAEAGGEQKKKKKRKLGTGALIAIVVGDTLVLVLLVVIFLFYYWRRYSAGVSDEKPHSEKFKGNEEVGQSGEICGRDSEAELAKMVFFDARHEQQFELEDLLRASAEMLGKGSFGTAYKAVLETGLIYVVKRVRDAKGEIAKNDFEKHMELLGKLKHPNIVPLRAYYYAKSEKLIVYDYMANGNLFSILHGDKSVRRTVALDWTSRLRIAREVAVGVAYIHQEWESRKLLHGNIKSSNVLIGKNYEICISDVGLAALMNPSFAAQRMAGYRAPEYSHMKKITQKADVYSFGVLLLELLTGRQPSQSQQSQGAVDLPKWVNSVVREEWTAEVFDRDLKTQGSEVDEMVTLLQIAMACLTSNPEERPKMAQVVKLIDQIRPEDFGESSGSYDSQAHSDDFTGEDSPSDT
ncbi:hypothetical protein R1sor_000712 [Riccia sorocarpa]|uniref:Protein kinase domain-containing protein n=1 Tax=Riccia sorocarpa TaxID=122646 RepID=A0ABD3GX41_9MARC